MGKRAGQLSLARRGVGKGRGGWRAAAGRPAKRVEERKGHHRRPELSARVPVHVTLKRVADGPAFRRGAAFAVLRRCFARGKDKFGFRLVHFTVQSNHLHLVCEADDRRALSRGMQGLAIRIARNLNRKVGRTGKLFAQRYHARILRSPREVRNVLVYVLNNARHHRSGQEIARSWIDPFSSAPWFGGWRDALPTEPWFRPDGVTPVVAATSWLLREGWRGKRGGLGFDEVPAG